MQLTLLALPPAGLAAAGWMHRWITDDGFIYLRVVSQVTSGHGPVFNIGERVEAFTSPLWLVLLSLADVLSPVRLEWIAVLLGLAGTVAGLALAMMGAARLVRPHAPASLLVPFGAVVPAVLLPMWYYATSGLETGLIFLWLGASFAALATWARTDTPLRASHAALLGLGWLVRPDLAIYSAAFVGSVAVIQLRKGGLGKLVRLLVAAFALPAVYQLFRMGYYGALVANTAVAKEGTMIRWARGVRYLDDFFSQYWLWVPLLLILACGYLPLALTLRERSSSRSVVVAGATLVGAAAQGLYVVAVGGDYFHARMLLPALFALCAPVAVVPATRRFAASVLLLPWAAVSAVHLRPLQTSTFLANGTVMHIGRDRMVTTDDIGWGEGGGKRAWYKGRGYYFEPGTSAPGRANYVLVDKPLRPGLPLPLGAIDGVGASGYAMGDGFFVFDVLGLGDPITSHLRITPTSAAFPLPGHEKPLPPPWIVARLFPATVRAQSSDVPAVFFPIIPATRGAEFERQVAFARKALRCAPVRRLVRSADAPLTPRRFLRNILDSFANNRLRIPPDPEEAYRTLCGRAAPDATPDK